MRCRLITAADFSVDGNIKEGVQIYSATPMPDSQQHIVTETDSTEEVDWLILEGGDFPYKNVPPYMGFKAYDLRNVKQQPIITHQELDEINLKFPKSGGYEPPIKLKYNGITNGDSFSVTSAKTLGYRSKNLCDISHSKSDIGYVGATTAGDGQKGFAKFDSFEHGIASAMRLLKRKYSGKSLIGINNGFQGYYKRGEDKSLTALRLYSITDYSKDFGDADPKRIIDFNDKDTLCSYTAVVAKHETGAKFSWNFLYRCYNMAFSK